MCAVGDVGVLERLDFEVALPLEVLVVVGEEWGEVLLAAFCGLAVEALSDFAEGYGEGFVGGEGGAASGGCLGVGEEDEVFGFKVHDAHEGLSERGEEG